MKAILDTHFNKVLNFARDNRFEYKAYNQVIFTEGMAETMGNVYLKKLNALVQKKGKSPSKTKHK